MRMEKVEVAKILKPQGVKGDLKVELILKDEIFWKKCNIVFIDEKEYSVVGYSKLGNYAIVHFGEVNDRNNAENLRNKFICIEKELLPKTNDDEYYIQGLVGCKVFSDEGEEIGIVESIENYGSTDIVNIIGSRGYFSFPFLKKVILGVNLTDKTILIRKKDFDEVCVC